MRRLLRRGTDNARLAAVSAAARIKASELLPDVVQLLPTSLGPEVATRIVDWGEEALAYVQGPSRQRERRERAPRRDRADG